MNLDAEVVTRAFNRVGAKCREDAQFAQTTDDGCVLPDEMLPEIIGTPLRRFDKGGAQRIDSYA